MALKKDLSWVSISLLIFMLVLTPLVQSSRALFQGGKITENTAMATQDLQTNLVDMRFEKAGSALTSVKDSARQVPTGPDPLHHNNNPAGP